MWTLPFTDAAAEMPFDPAHSWLLGLSRGPSAALAGVATAAFVVAAVGYLASVGWWPSMLLAGAAVSLLLMLLTFTPWWSVGIALSTGLAVYAWQA